MKGKQYYFDYAATTPLDKWVFLKMKPYFSENFGNPSNLYESGRKAKLAISEAINKITKVLNCAPGEFIFTSGATEADNLAIAGIARANKEFGNKIIISAVEHKGIMSVCDALKKEGFEIVKIPVDKFGTVDLKKLKKEINSKTILVSITYADSETGTAQPVAEIAKIIRKFREGKHSKPYTLNPIPYFHTDASQAAPYLDINIENIGVDLMTLSAHKIYGPKGIGGLYIKKGIKIKPIIFGGGQQSLRSGTQNVPAIVGFGEAIILAEKNKKAEFKHAKQLRDKLEKGIFKIIPKVVLNGHSKNRLPNFLNISILDIEGEALLLYLDEKGIAVGTGSACNSENLEPSYILSALGRSYEYIHGSVRFTMGKYTTDSDINYVLKNLPEMVKKLRQISPLNLKIKKPKKISQLKAFVGGKTPHFLRRK
ncbi:MAG: cysteine desulfurase [Candidatus Wolfebacteria bacterium]|nr:cysteine desulfurase [Candidatus Wolfebacteria bacterium]